MGRVVSSAPDLSPKNKLGNYVSMREELQENWPGHMAESSLSVGRMTLGGLHGNTSPEVSGLKEWYR